MILGIYGAGGLGREVLVLARQINRSEPRWQDMVFIDDSASTATLKDKPVFTLAEIQNRYSAGDIEIAIAVGEPAVRRILRTKVANAGFRLATLVHPSVILSEDTTLGEGAIICCQNFLSCDVQIGRNVLMQPCASIGHDSVIGDDSVISTYVCIAGGCRIGDEAYIGLQVAVREKGQIGSRSIIGMSSSVVRDIPDDVIALGNPARVVKENTEHRVFHKTSQEG